MRQPAISLAGCCLALAACASTVPDLPGPADIGLPDEFAADLRPPSGIGDAWWTGFHDPQLDALIELALAEDLDISEAALAASIVALYAAVGAPVADSEAPL